MYSHEHLVRLAAIASVLEHGLDVNRLLFARYLERAGRLSEWPRDLPAGPLPVPGPPAPRILRAIEWTAWT